MGLCRARPLPAHCRTHVASARGSLFCSAGRALLTGRVYAPVDLPFMSEPLLAFRPDFGLGHAYNGTLTDLYQQNIPWRYAVQWAWTHGEWPLLNPFMLCGDILAAAA